eukprot:6193070-Alexandrium_andersonii.AAC.1
MVARSARRSPRQPRRPRRRCAAPRPERAEARLVQPVLASGAAIQRVRAWGRGWQQAMRAQLRNR